MAMESSEGIQHIVEKARQKDMDLEEFVTHILTVQLKKVK